MTPAVKISKQLQAIAAELDARLEGLAGERVALPRGDRDKELRNMRKHKRANLRKQRAKARAKR